MPTRRRTRLAAGRLLLIFVLLCLSLGELGAVFQHLRESRLGISGPFPAQASTPFLGIHVDLQQYTPVHQQRAAARLAATGFEWARIRLAWDEIEPDPGVFAWREADAMVAALVEAGLAPVLLLDRSPAWARAEPDRTPHDNPHAPPADPADFARFAQAVAQRYGAAVRYYQVWRQPNIAPYWGARHIEPVAYAQLLKAAAAAIRHVDADAYILTASLAPTVDRGHTAIDEVAYLQRLYAAGAAASFDAVAIQPLGFGATPRDTRRLETRLLFQRARIVRQAMLDAGDSLTPVWLMRFGWNVSDDSPWGTVKPAFQHTYTLDALDIAYTSWPWVAAMGWPVDRPAAAYANPVWGYALSDGMAAGLRAWQATRPVRPTPLAPSSAPPLALWAWLGAIVALGWRGVAAARLIPWATWRTAYRTRPFWQHVVVWSFLAAVYYLATWPPLVLACWCIAALLIAGRPRVGLGLALALLPFHAYHKEITWADVTIAVPPTQALLLCLAPVLLARLATTRRRVFADRPWDRWDGLGLGWLGVALLGAAGAWHWPAYAQGILDLVVVPLILFVLLRHFGPTWNSARPLAAALALGGVLAASAGLVEWVGGSGTLADGFRRLVGPTYSPNHTALYLLRSLFLSLGLAWTAQNAVRGRWWVGAAIVATALLLTFSRGALLLGLPAGLLTLWLAGGAPHTLPRQARVWLLAAIAVVLGLLVAVWGERLLNLATIGARWEGWQATWGLIRDHLWTGVGPGGFYWSYPAYLPPGYPAEPNLRHPHQLWLELASSGGLAAIGWFVVAAVLVTRFLRAQPNRHPLQRALVAGMIAALAHAQVDAFQALPDLAAWNWAALALLIAGQDKAAAPKDSGST